MHVLVIMTDMTSYAERCANSAPAKAKFPEERVIRAIYIRTWPPCMNAQAWFAAKRGLSHRFRFLPCQTMTSPPGPRLDRLYHRRTDCSGPQSGQQRHLSASVRSPFAFRLMKDGIGAGYTRKDHSALSNQLFAAYAKVMDARSLASVIGEEELSPTDKKYLEFGKRFENQYVNQGSMKTAASMRALTLVGGCWPHCRAKNWTAWMMLCSINIMKRPKAA